jgi:hypothetical protein
MQVSRLGFWISMIAHTRYANRCIAEGNDCNLNLIYKQKRRIDMGLISEFKKFAMRVSVIDMAVGIIYRSRVW